MNDHKQQLLILHIDLNSQQWKHKIYLIEMQLLGHMKWIMLAFVIVKESRRCKFRHNRFSTFSLFDVIFTQLFFYYGNICIIDDEPDTLTSLTSVVID